MTLVSKILGWSTHLRSHFLTGFLVLSGSYFSSLTSSDCLTIVTILDSSSLAYPLPSSASLICPLASDAASASWFWFSIWSCYMLKVTLIFYRLSDWPPPTLAAVPSSLKAPEKLINSVVGCMEACLRVLFLFVLERSTSGYLGWVSGPKDTTSFEDKVCIIKCSILYNK